MILFSTTLEIKKKMTKDDFIQLVIRWNQESSYASNIIPDITWNGKRNIKYGNGNLWLEFIEYRNKNIIAVRYEKREENGTIWDTDYIMNFNDMLLTVCLDRSFSPDSIFLGGDYSTPHFISLLIDEKYIKKDYNLYVKYTPETDEEKVFEVMSGIKDGKSQYRLPIIYVSKTYFDENPVDIELLAKNLKGAAHVLVQESCRTNERMNEIYGEDYEKNGTIGIYYTFPNTLHKKYFYHASMGYDSSLFENVTRYVISNSNSKHIDDLYTWPGVRNALFMDKLESKEEKQAQLEEQKNQLLFELEKLKENNEQEEKTVDDVENYISEFDAEIREFRKELKVLSQEKAQLQSENRGLREELKSQLLENENPVLLCMGEENDLYPDEIKDLVLSTLSKALQDFEEKSRRADVIDDIIRNNNYEGISVNKAKQIKSLLKTYEGMTQPIRQALIRLGFEITEEGSHHKLKYYGDDRYVESLAKTPSDVREGQNAASQFINKCF